MNTTRRNILSGIGASTLLGLAGCSFRGQQLASFNGEPAEYNWDKVQESPYGVERAEQHDAQEVLQNITDRDIDVDAKVYEVSYIHETLPNLLTLHSIPLLRIGDSKTINPLDGETGEELIDFAIQNLDQIGEVKDVTEEETLSDVSFNIGSEEYTSNVQVYRILASTSFGIEVEFLAHVSQHSRKNEALLATALLLSGTGASDGETAMTEEFDFEETRSVAFNVYKNITHPQEWSTVKEHEAQ